MMIESNKRHPRLAFPGSVTPRLPLALCALLISSACASTEPRLRDGKPLHSNQNQAGLALEGFDPVAYFPMGGGQAARGQQELEVEFDGATYRFASSKNQRAFLEDPERFAPAYGGWCAWAMVDGEKVGVDPKSFLIQEGRLLLFYDGLFADTRKSWSRGDVEQLGQEADQQWGRILGRSKGAGSSTPRLGLEGQDPVGLGQGAGAQPGLSSIITRYRGVEYHFSSEKNRLSFLRNPELHLGRVSASDAG